MGAKGQRPQVPKTYAVGKRERRPKISEGPQFEVTGTHVVIFVGALFALAWFAGLLEGTCVGRVSLEGVAVQRVTARDMGRDVTAEDLCSMSGAYVKAALRMDAVPKGWPILLVHDGQNTQKAGKLRKNWHAVETHATAYADLILAVRSAYFIGNPASSFSANVVMIRRALGAAPTSSNLRVLDFPRPGSYK